MVGLSHAENVAKRTTRRVTDDHHPALQRAIAKDSSLTVVLTRVFGLHRDTRKYKRGIFEIESTISKRLVSLCRIVGCTYPYCIYDNRMPEPGGVHVQLTNFCRWLIAWENYASCCTST